MAELIADCPRCGANAITFEVRSINEPPRHYTMPNRCEAFTVCRNCWMATVFILEMKVDFQGARYNSSTIMDIQGTVNTHVDVIDYINIVHMIESAPPENVPDTIEAVFREASVCFSAKCYNAAGTMFRLCIDMATRDLLGRPESQATPKVMKYGLKQRLSWMFENKVLPSDLEDLSDSVREDGNDGAHAGTLTLEDASDLQDFTKFLLERIFTEPGRIRLAKERRDERRRGD